MQVRKEQERTEAQSELSVCVFCLCVGVCCVHTGVLILFLTRVLRVESLNTGLWRVNACVCWFLTVAQWY